MIQVDVSAGIRSVLLKYAILGELSSVVVLASRTVPNTDVVG